MISVDRIEGSIAVCETDSGFVNIALSSILGKVKEGVILKKNGNGYSVDERATAARKAELFEKQQQLFNK